MDEFIGFFAFENFIHIGLLSQCIFIDILLHGTLKLLDSVILKFLSKLEKFLLEKWEKEYIWKTSCHPSRTQSTWTYFYVEKCRKAKIQNLKNEKKINAPNILQFVGGSGACFFCFFRRSCGCGWRTADGARFSIGHSGATNSLRSRSEAGRRWRGGCAALLFDDDEWTPLPNAVKPHLTTPDSHLPFIRAPDVSVGTVTKKLSKINSHRMKKKSRKQYG